MHNRSLILTSLLIVFLLLMNIFIISAQQTTGRFTITAGAVEESQNNSSETPQLQKQDSMGFLLGIKNFFKNIFNWLNK